LGADVFPANIPKSFSAGFGTETAGKIASDETMAIRRD
jgi:hypothetical protein